MAFAALKVPTHARRIAALKVPAHADRD